MALLHFDLDDELHRRAKARAAMEGTSLKAWVTAAIASALDAAERAEKRTR